MKKIEIFGYQLTLDLEKKNWDDPEIYSKENVFREKILYLIIIACIFVLSKQIDFISGRDNYKAGDVVAMDLYSPKSTIYRDEDAKNKIIEQMILGAGKEYLFVSSVEKHYIENFDNFFEQVKTAKAKRVGFNNTAFEKESGIKISHQLPGELMKLSNTEIERRRKLLRGILEKIYQTGVFEEGNVIRISEIEEEKIEKLPKLSGEIIKLFIAPNYIYDPEKTKNSIKEKVNQVEDQLVSIYAGDLIAKKGEIITDQKLKLMEAVGIYSFKKNLFIICLNIVYLATISTLFYMLSRVMLQKEILNKNLYRSSLLLTTALLAMYRFSSIDYLYLMPFDAVLFLLLILTNSNFTFILLIFEMGLMLPLIDFNTKFFLINIFTMMYSIYLIKKIRTRSEVLNIGIKIAIIKVMLFVVLTILFKDGVSGIVLKSGMILASGMISGMLTLAFIPYFEKTFNLLNIFKLIELGDLSNPLLKRLSLEAPGTFQHSVMVATLSENAAEAIGADAIFSRVAAYYHDIGKIKRAKFFVENQSSGINPHDGISVFLSNMIIKSHTKDGVEIGKKYKIPKEIRDIMMEHQGTTLLAYFFNKAKQLDSSVKKEDFKYPGPKPRTKESAIIMLADSVEAAVRSLDEKTSVTIEEMVRKIINSKIEDNQLSEADLTFREIEEIIKSFVITLSSIHHARMKYPGQK